MRVDDGVLNVGVPEPILHKTKIVSGFQKVSRSRVFQDVEVSLVRRQPCGLAVLSKS
jgi:hypothetical protein